MPKTKRSHAAVAIGACVLAALALAAPAGAKTYPVRGTQTVIDEDAGLFRMHGSLIGRWAGTSFEVLGTDPYFHARGTERFTGCLDRKRDRSCKRDPKGTLSFTFEYWALFATDDPESHVWGSCWHPIVEGTGDFAGAQGVVMMVDTPTRDGVVTKYIGNVTLKGHGGKQRVSTASAARSRCG